jgi:hypothetical protein
MFFFKHFNQKRQSIYPSQKYFEHMLFKNSERHAVSWMHLCVNSYEFRVNKLKECLVYVYVKQL